VLGLVGGLPMNRITWEAKYANSTKVYVFDFTSQLAIGETISSAVVSASSFSAASGAVVTLGTCSISGARVSVPVSAGTEGAVFLIRCEIETSLSQTLVQVAYLPVIPEGM